MNNPFTSNPSNNPSSSNTSTSPNGPNNMTRRRSNSLFDWAFDLGHGGKNIKSQHHINQREYTTNLWVGDRRRSSGAGING